MGKRKHLEKSLPDRKELAEAIPLFIPESGGTYKVPGRVSEDREISREHARIVNSLAEELQRQGIEVYNRHVTQLGVADLVILGQAVFEVKATSAIAEMQRAAGQLLFYSSDVGELDKVHKIAVVPEWTQGLVIKRLQQQGFLTMYWKRRGSSYSFIGLARFLRALAD